eukprot:10597824-Karenia_brevis.AAC.1
MIQGVEKELGPLPEQVQSVISTEVTDRATLWLLEFGLAGEVTLPIGLTEDTARDPSTFTGDMNKITSWVNVKKSVSKLLSAYIDGKYLAAMGHARGALPKTKKLKKKAQQAATGEQDGEDCQDESCEEESAEADEEEEAENAADAMTSGVLDLIDTHMLDEIVVHLRTHSKLLHNIEEFRKQNKQEFCKLDKLNVNILRRKHPALDAACQLLFQKFDAPAGSKSVLLDQLLEIAGADSKAMSKDNTLDIDE